MECEPFKLDDDEFSSSPSHETANPALESGQYEYFVSNHWCRVHVKSATQKGICFARFSVLADTPVDSILNQATGLMENMKVVEKLNNISHFTFLGKNNLAYSKLLIESKEDEDCIIIYVGFFGYDDRRIAVDTLKFDTDITCDSCNKNKKRGALY
ncbi:hypothetical protein IWW57_001628 [Coemansia sp. S610]|nr:hypothetical protein IWW57_001628 [Coemansia sp. S610]